MSRILLPLLISASFLVTACKKALPLDEYLVFVQDPENGLVQSAKVGSFNYTLEYQPVELVAVRNLGSSYSGIDKDSLDHLCQAYSHLQYYQLRISSDSHPDFLKTNLSHNSEYYARIGYYSSSAQNDFWLVQGLDSVPCTAYHFERSYGINPYNTIILGFKSSIEKSNPVVAFNDRALATGWLHFTFSKTDLNDIPQIKL